MASDHAAGVWPDEKQTGSIWTDYGGVPGVELLLPTLYSEGVDTGRITLERLVEVTAAEPAAFFGVAHRKGRIEAGFDADLAVIDETQSYTVRAEELHNKNRYTPLDGRVLAGRVVQTWVRGRKVFDRIGVDAEGAFAASPTRVVHSSGGWLMKDITLLGPGVVLTAFGPAKTGHRRRWLSSGRASASSPSVHSTSSRFAMPGPGSSTPTAGLILPGLVNLHHHFYSALARGLDPGVRLADFGQILEGLWWRLDRALDPDTVRLSAALSLADCIRWGCTTVFDHHASPTHLRGSLGDHRAGGRPGGALRRPVLRDQRP